MGSSLQEKEEPEGRVLNSESSELEYEQFLERERERGLSGENVHTAGKPSEVIAALTRSQPERDARNKKIFDEFFADRPPYTREELDAPYIGTPGEGLARTEFDRVMTTDPTVHSMTRSGFSYRDIIVQLVAEKEMLVKLLKDAHARRPIQIVALDKSQTPDTLPHD